MACEQGVLELKAGSDNEINFAVVSNRLTITFTVDTPTVAPAAGDFYSFEDKLFQVVTSDSSTVTMYSEIEDEGELPAAGTLVRATGSGDSTLSFLSYTSSNYINATGHSFTDVKFKLERTSTTNLLEIDDFDFLVPSFGRGRLVLTSTQMESLPGSGYCYFTYSITGPVYRPQEIWDMIQVKISPNN